FYFFFQAEDGIRDPLVTGVQTCALPILVVHKKESGLRVFADWTAQTAAENILLYHRAGLTRAIQEILIGIKLVIAEEFVHITVKSLGSGFEDRVYVAAAVATLTGVVEGGLNFEFTNYVGVR